ncbi:MAG: tetratricopeptide repeat protein [Pirellulaceae bacterium]
MRKVFSGSIPRVFSSLASVIVLWLLIFSSPSALAQGTATVSPDLVSLYRTTEGKLDAASLDKIVAQCSDVLAEAQRTKADRRYAQQLLAWAANQRGQMASDEAGRLVEEGDLEAAAALDRKAVADFHLALQHDPQMLKARHNLAVGLALHRKYEEAILQFSEVLKASPKHLPALANRAELHFQVQSWDAAERDYTDAIEIAPKDAALWNGRAHARLMLQRYELSLEDYRKATELEPSRAGYLVDYADACQSLGKWKAASEAYVRAIQLDPKEIRAKLNAAWLLATCPEPAIRRPQMALQVAESMTQDAIQQDYRYWDTLAAVHASAGDSAKAVEYLARGLELAPEELQGELRQRGALYGKGRAYLQPMDPMALSAMVGEEPTVRRANATESPAVGSGLKASR